MVWIGLSTNFTGSTTYCAYFGFYRFYGYDFHNPEEIILSENFNLTNLGSMNSTSKYYITLAELKTNARFETLDAFESAQEKVRTFQNDHPEFSKYLAGLLEISRNITPLKKWVREIKETHQAISGYLNAHRQLSKGIHLLPAEGWYFSMEFIDALGIGNLDEYLSKNPKGFEKDVTDTFYARMNLIEEKLAAAFPSRAGLLKTIFTLHQTKIYEGSIPMALAQADGMCKETFSLVGKNGKIVPVGFFDMDRNKSEILSQKLSKSFELPETSIFNILYNQLAHLDRNSSLVLEGNTKRLSDLNRHAILHGESINYGTETNSIKAILLLDFIEDLRIMDQVLKEK